MVSTYVSLNRKIILYSPYCNIQVCNSLFYPNNGQYPLSYDDISSLDKPRTSTLLHRDVIVPMLVPRIGSRYIITQYIELLLSSCARSSGIANILYIKPIQYTSIFGHTMACMSHNHIEREPVKYTKMDPECMFSNAQYKSLLFLQTCSPDL